MSIKPKTKHTYVDDLIASAVIELQNHEVNSDEYGAVLDRITKLQKIRKEERDSFEKDLPSADTLILAATNLIGIMMILHHEKLAVITSKATSFAQKVR